MRRLWSLLKIGIAFISEPMDRDEILGLMKDAEIKGAL